MLYGSGGYYGESVAVADVNGDGKPDLVVANNCTSAGRGGCTNFAGVVGVLLGNGDGTFQTAMPYGSGGYDADSVVVADLNGDGKPDLVVTNRCVDANCQNSTAAVLLANGDGTFQMAVAYSSGGWYTNLVAVADMNGDGKRDLAVANTCIASRTNREVHVRICGRLGAKFPGPTRQLPGPTRPEFQT